MQHKKHEYLKLHTKQTGTLTILYTLVSVVWIKPNQVMFFLFCSVIYYGKVQGENKTYHRSVREIPSVLLKGWRGFIKKYDHTQ